ncbi:MAG: CRISPR-associated protein Cas5, partial [Clostridia bacterium]|nr:CRISPR-associated protein Cas5 [Clostridia bacterium]
MYRITLQSTTAFFKNDMTITSIQQTYECPPLSTIYGLISAAVGERVESIPVGYIFDYKYKTQDYELITRPLGSEYNKPYYELMKSGKAIDRHDILQGFFGAVPITREILFDCTLKLYIGDEAIANSFLNPYYTMLMGRSEDLAFVKEVKKVE